MLACELTVCTIEPGLSLTLRDIENESVLISIQNEWYRAHLDDFVTLCERYVSASSIKKERVAVCCYGTAERAAMGALARIAFGKT